MKDPFQTLKGNEEQKAYFRAQIAAGSLLHAYILEGEEGTGKHTLAAAVAAALAGDLPGASDKILRGICPDVKIFSRDRDKQFFTVEIVRKIKSEAFLLPSELSFKLYVLENTERMNSQAQNAALKLLEEPPKNTYFFLLCENASALLPTVRSRAPVIRMQRFTNEELKRLLLLTGVKESERFEAAIKSSAGSYGKALRALSQTGAQDDFEALSRLLHGLGQATRAQLLLLVLALPVKRREFDDALSSLSEALRDMLLVRCGGAEEDLLWFSSAEEARTCCEGLTRAGISAMYERVEALKEQISRNINMQSAALSLANELYAAARR